MISEKDFLRYEKQTSKLYEDLELDLINDIAQRIADVGELNTVGYNNAVILQQMGKLYEDIINDVAKHNQMSSAEVKKIFDNAGITSIKKDDVIYKQAGISPGKISNTLYNIMERQADDTNYNILRLTRTIANTGQEQFINAINQAYLETSSGMKSYSQAIIDAVDKVGKQGAIVKYPSGVTRSVESAIRMNVLTSVGQMSGELQLERAQEVGWDLVEVSAHIGARPEHAEWQGKVYSLSGSNGYKDFYIETGYGSMLGLCGINCRHTFFPYYKGSTLTYTKNELEEMKNAKVHYNGQEMSYYDATQLQRRMERQIRQNRKDIAGLKGLKNSDVDAEQLQSELIKANNKLAQRQNILDDFIRQTEFKDNDRTYIGNITTSSKVEIEKSKKYAKIEDENSKKYVKIEDENYKKLKEQASSYINQLSKEQQNALIDYTNHDYIRINNYLRNKTISNNENIIAETKNYIKNINEAMVGQELGIDTKLYRVVDALYFDDFIISPEDIAKGEKWLEEKLLGGNYTDKAYQSTSLLEDRIKFGKFEIEYLADKNTNGIYLESISTHSDEKEFLLNRNYNSIIQKVEMKKRANGEQIVKITAKLIGVKNGR